MGVAAMAATEGPSVATEGALAATEEALAAMEEASGVMEEDSGVTEEEEQEEEGICTLVSFSFRVAVLSVCAMLTRLPPGKTQARLL